MPCAASSQVSQVTSVRVGRHQSADPATGRAATSSATPLTVHIPSTAPRVISSTNGRLRCTVPASGHGATSSPTPTVDSAAPSRLRPRRHFVSHTNGRLRCAVPASGHGAASSPT